MAKEYKIENVYQGGISSFSPSYGGSLTESRTNAGSLSITHDTRTANILSEISSKLGMGIKNIEVQGVQPDVFESIPQQHLKEVNRLAKLTGVDVTFHGPVIEASGISNEGFSDFAREAVERQMNLAVERGHEMNPKGNIPVTFHSSALLPWETPPKGKERPDDFLAINIENGKINRFPIQEKKFFPGEEKSTVENELKRQNEQSWKSALTNLAYSVERASEYLGSSAQLGEMAKAEERAGKELVPQERRMKTMQNVGEAFLQDSYREFKNLYEIAYKQGNDEEKKKLYTLAKEIEGKVNEINKDRDNLKSLSLRKEIVEEGLDVLKQINTPKIFDSLNNFAKEKSVETFANVALNSYKKFGDTAPIINIENPPAGGAFSTGEELADVVKKARDKFVEKAKQEGMSENDARKQAEKLLGVTWDVGHINMIKKYGYENKDILKETEKIAPLTKHVHLSDNFGFEHTELPMGMGNVPMKEILERLNKEGFEGKKVIEAFNWWQHFKTPPLLETLEAMGSPIYSMQMAPYWNQSIGLQQGYFSGYGQLLPQGNYETFGAGFSNLPAELGGQRQGAGGSRMSGRPME